MRLLNLVIRNFRGFGVVPVSIALDGDLIIFYGPNGFSKTSLAEAVEWLFYGTTKRRQHGESYSLSEYVNTYANVHGGSPTEVSATIIVGGQQYTVSRRLRQGDASETLVDGAVAPFTSIGISPIEAVYPVVAQHGLQTFVHSKPKDRRDAICAALGLDELTSLKSALESARLSFLRTPPRAIAQARVEIAAHAPTLAQLKETQELAGRWQRMPPLINLAADTEALLRAARALTAEECVDTTTALTSLRTRRLAASRSIFDASRLAPNAAQIPSVQSTFDAAVDAFTTVERAIATVAASMAAAYSTAFLELWKMGLELSPAGDQCPMCEEATLTAAKRAILAKRLADNADHFAKGAALTNAVTTAKARIARAQGQIDEFGVAELSEPELEQLAKLLAGQADALEAYIAHAHALLAQRASAKQKLAAATAFLDRCGAELQRADNAPRVVGQSAEVKEALSAVPAPTVDVLRSYTEAWKAFEPKLSMLISSDALVACVDAVGKSLGAEFQLRILSRYDAILAETQELIRAVEAEMQARQASLLATRGAEVKDLYDRLNRGADVVFDQMEPGTDSMKLHATSFGRRMSAAANLSECQLNCLGLAMWLMRATTPSSPFAFVILDDPVQSMDDDHTEAFISDIIPHLLDGHGKQVIVLSHVKRITERLRELNSTRRVRLYHYESYALAGPTITEQIAFQMILAEIKGASRGNEENRKYCVDRIRVLVEHFVRELHLKQMGVTAPPQYDRSSAKELLPIFQAITGTTPQEHVGLRDTIRFCDPAHHTQVGYAVPVQSNIQPHIDRMEGLIRKYGL